MENFRSSVMEFLNSLENLIIESYFVPDSFNKVIFCLDYFKGMNIRIELKFIYIFTWSSISCIIEEISYFMFLEFNRLACQKLFQCLFSENLIRVVLSEHIFNQEFLSKWPYFEHFHVSQSSQLNR